MNRQCSLGWHDECTDPFGESCECECHPWILRNDPAEIRAAARPLADLEAADQVLGAAQFLANPFARSTAEAIVDAALGADDE